MSYSSKAVANEFLQLAKMDSEELTQMKLQKLVCIAHGYSLAILDKPLICDQIEAWKYGPIIPELYQEFKVFGKYPINTYAKDIEIGDNFEILQSKPHIKENDNENKDLIKTVWDTYKIYTGPNLSDMTHREGTPWDKTYLNEVIDDTLMAEHYKQLIN